MNNRSNTYKSMSGNLKFFAFLILLVAITSSCKKFLDVQPQDKVPQSTLFNSEQGFKDALNGVYLALDKPSPAALYGLYTSNLNMGMMSALAYDYDNVNTGNVGGNGTFFNNLSNYNYMDVVVRTEIDNIWSIMYSNIANLNNLLAQMEIRRDVFTGDNYQRIKGEALALRAMMHFDLARMFGKSPVDGMNEKAIPYIRSYGIRPTSFATLANALDSCIDDLHAAKQLLATTDTSQVVKASEDLFISYTQNHVNYWAVQGLMARVYLYKGDRDNAEFYARSVIGSNKFPLITSNIAAAVNPIRDRTFSQEHLFAVYSSNVRSYNLKIFDVPGTGNPLRLTPTGKTKIYVSGSGNALDYRNISWFDNSQGNVSVPSKFFQDNNLPYILQNIVPVIRVSEMFYIAAEVANGKGDKSGSVSLLNQVRQARGLGALNASGITNVDSVYREITREYQKEFIQEGQTFFYYKRLNKNLKQETGTTAAIPENVYQFPIPDKEKEYNH